MNLLSPCSVPFRVYEGVCTFIRENPRGKTLGSATLAYFGARLWYGSGAAPRTKTFPFAAFPPLLPVLTNNLFGPTSLTLVVEYIRPGLLRQSL